MTQKNQTIPLILSLIITLGIIGTIYWLVVNQLGINFSPSPSPPNKATLKAFNTFKEVPNIPSWLFNYGGSTTWAPIRKSVDQELQNVHPNFRLRYTDPISGTPGSSNGIRMLIDDQLAFSQSSRPLKDEEYERAKKRGFTLKQIPVAIDSIAIAIHPDLNVPGITIDQLRDIYLGKITNWQQVGGPDLSIRPYSRRPEDGGTVEFFQKNILDQENFGQNIIYIFSTTQALRKVAEEKGSIYYASAPEVVPQCTVKTLPLGQKPGQWVTAYQTPFIPLSQCPQKRNQLNKSAFQKGEYPITRRLFVIIKENGEVDQQAGKAYAQLLLTQQGQDLIEEAGFISIR
ncbi:MAG TPA: phosphate ABC transporter substrate-binding protein [Cyanothece sp. UBA12306]|nr:phosphate ABC transporter substrate-binding protein [Cyanothece sp. UBA12306]